MRDPFVAIRSIGARRCEAAINILTSIWHLSEATSYFGVGLALFREGGVGKLFAGLPLYWAKVAPAAGVQFGVYAGLKNWWGRRHDP